MECKTAMDCLDDFLDNSLDTDQSEQLKNHLSSCSECTEKYNQANSFQSILKNLPVPIIEDEFSKRAILFAAKKKKPAPTWLKIAACLIIAIGVARFYPGSTENMKGENLSVTVSINKPENIRLVFNSNETLNDVTFKVTMPDTMKLIGYENQRTIVWQGNLDKGQNLLTLPVITSKLKGGKLIAEIRHGEKIKQFDVSVFVNDLNRLIESSRDGEHTPSIYIVYAHLQGRTLFLS